MHNKTTSIAVNCLVYIIVSLPFYSHSNPETTITLHGFSTIYSPPFAWLDTCTGELTGSSQHVFKKAFQDNGAKLIIEQPLSPYSNQWHEQGRRLIRGDLDIFLTNNLDIYRLDNEKITRGDIPATIIEGGFFSLKENGLVLTDIDQAKGKKAGLPSNLKAFLAVIGKDKDVFFKSFEGFVDISLNIC